MLTRCKNALQPQRKLRVSYAFPDEVTMNNCNPAPYARRPRPYFVFEQLLPKAHVQSIFVSNVVSATEVGDQVSRQLVSDLSQTSTQLNFICSKLLLKTWWGIWLTYKPVCLFWNFSLKQQYKGVRPI